MVKIEKQQITDAILTPANILTAFRLLLMPVYCVFFLVLKQNVWAFGVLCIAALTDLLDGQLARFTNTVSRLGEQLDPFVDRIFILISVLTIYASGRLPFWLLVSFIVRDALMLAITMYQKARFNREFKVIFLGKITTALAMAGFCSLVLEWPTIPGLGIYEVYWLPGIGPHAAPLGYLFLYLGTFCSWISAMYYILRGLQATEDISEVVAETDAPLSDRS